MLVVKYKLELQEEKVINQQIDDKVQEVAAETTKLFKKYTPDEIAQLRPSNFVAILQSFNDSIMMLRRRMT